MGDFIFGELLFGSWTEQRRIITVRNPINDYEFVIPKNAIIGLLRHKQDHYNGKHYAQNISLEPWYTNMIQKQMKNPFNKYRGKARAIYEALNKNRKYYILEKVELEQNLKAPHPTGLP